MPHPRHRRVLRSALAFVLVACASSAVAQLAGVAGPEGPIDPTQVVVGGTHERWLVKAPEGDAAAQLRSAANQLGGGSAGSELAGGWYEVDLRDEVAAADAELVFGGAGAVDVEPVLPRVPYDEPAAVDDGPEAFGEGTVPLREGPLRATRLGEQWALSQGSDEDIDGPEAWQGSTGSGAVVAVIDTGVDASHPDLAGRVLTGRDFSGSSTGATHDAVGHGTQVASIVAAGGGGMAGVAPDAQILPLKVFRDSAGSFSMSGYLAAIRYAADQGADVINISLGCGGTTSCYSQAEMDAIAYAATKGTLVVAAAGNGDASGNGIDNDDGDDPRLPVGVRAAEHRRGHVQHPPGGLVGVVQLRRAHRRRRRARGSHPRCRRGGRLPQRDRHVVLRAARRRCSPRWSPRPTRRSPSRTCASQLLAGAQARPTLRGRTVTGGVLNAWGALALPAAADATSGGSGPALVAPATGARAAAPPTLTWTLPRGWSSVRVVLRLGAARYDTPVAAARRSLAQPPAAWRSGSYRWQVVARAPDGRLVTTPARTYRVAPRLGAWMSSGRVRSGGTGMKLRVGYAATEPSATVRVTVTAGGRTLHAGTGRRHAEHVRGTGSPRRGWFAYSAALRGSVAHGQRVVVSVTVAAGGSTITRRFGARIA